MTRTRIKSRGQSMTEFALVAPILMLILFGILDLGRGIFYYIGISQALGEAARTASLATNGLPANSDVLTAAQTSASYISLAPCPNTADPSTTVPPSGQAYLFITDPAAPNANTDGANAPGGEAGSGSCPAVTAALQPGDKLQLTVVFTFSPITPFIQQVVGNQIKLTTTSVVQVEY